MKRKMIWGMVFIVWFAASSAGFLIFGILRTTAAKGRAERVQYVTCVEIRPGDTLWSIASAYLTEEYRDIPEYVEELKRCNRLIRDEIHAGQKLIVPYYTNAPRP